MMSRYTMMACHEPGLIEALADRVCRIEDGVIAERPAECLPECLCPGCALRARGACAGRG